MPMHPPKEPRKKKKKYDLQLKVKRLTKTAKLPTKAHDTDACFDVYSDKDCWISTRGSFSISTGISVQTPPGYHLEIRPRSSISKTCLAITNSPGTVDAGYTGEVKILIRNYNSWGGGDILINKGDRIAQIRLERDWDTEIVEVDELEEMDRGDNGFGSTGK